MLRKCSKSERLIKWEISCFERPYVSVPVSYNFFPLPGPKSEPSTDSTNNSKAPSVEGSAPAKSEAKPVPAVGGGSTTTAQLKALTDKLVSNHKEKPSATPPPPPTTQPAQSPMTVAAAAALQSAAAAAGNRSAEKNPAPVQRVGEGASCPSLSWGFTRLVWLWTEQASHCYAHMFLLCPLVWKFNS